MHPALSSVEHRPWPLPEARWDWRQSWMDLAFLHYRVDAGRLRPMIPASLALQEFDGSAWVGVVPFRMQGVSPRFLPGNWCFPSFPELNVRTYVEYEGKPGVWFFSLDASSLPFVIGGRVLFHLPYDWSRMTQYMDGNQCRFECRRINQDVVFQATYRPMGEPFLARPGTFEQWAAERYCLYSHGRGGSLIRVQVHHAPWPLRHGEVDIKQSNLLEALGIETLSASPVVHVSSGVDVVSFPAEELKSGSSGF